MVPGESPRAILRPGPASGSLLLLAIVPVIRPMKALFIASYYVNKAEESRFAAPPASEGRAHPVKGVPLTGYAGISRLHRRLALRGAGRTPGLRHAVHR